MTALSAEINALSVLAGCNLRELHLKRADGTRILDTLYHTCRAAGLVPAGTPDSSPKERYLAVFDAALRKGLGLWILDYVQVVCADRHLTSNDPLEAYLLDGGFVKLWAQGCLQRAEQAAELALKTDAAFYDFQNGPLQLQLGQTRILVSILRTLDGIRSAAGGGASIPAAATAPGAITQAAAQDRLSVAAELRQAVLLEQAFQVMDWCARQGLANPRAGLAARSYPDWSRAVNVRRSRAAPRPLFLDSLLQSLSLAGAYPSTSVQHMLHTLLLVVRDVDPATWTAKLALLSYYLLDAGLLDGPAGGPIAPGPASAAGAAAGAAAGGAARGPEAALADLRRTFRLPPAEVGLWQCNYLLDCALPDAPGCPDPHLARASALLPSCVTADTPFAFIEALLALGRPEVALAVDRGQSGSGPGGSAGGAGGGGGGRPGRTLSQAMTLLDVRLRCSLLTEAISLLRNHATDLKTHGSPSEAIQEHTRALVRRLATWAAESDAAAAAVGTAAQPAAAVAAAGQEGGVVAALANVSLGGEVGGAGGGWLNRLTELPLNAMEEAVLVEWLAEEADAGRPAGAFLPLFYQQRGRVNEATAACIRWQRRRDELAAAGAPVTPGSDPVHQVIAAVVDAAHRELVPPCLKNVAVPAAEVLPGEQKMAALVAGRGGTRQGQGAVGILQEYSVNDRPDQPAAFLAFHGAEPPPLLAAPVPLPPGPEAPPQAPSAAAAVAAPQAAVGMALALPAPSSLPGLGPAAVQPPFAAMPLQLPSSAPFRAPPGTPGLVGRTGGGGGASVYGSVAATAAGSGGGFGTASGGGFGGAPLFSVGAVLAAPNGGSGGGAAAGTPGGGPAPPRSSKRSKPNSWL